MAMTMPKESTSDKELDIWWQDAEALYDEFTKSKYNDLRYSELDCIKEFIEDRYKYFLLVKKYDKEVYELKIRHDKEVNEFNHRLAMVKDDIVSIRNFINNSQLSDNFLRETENASECWQHFLNIEIACDTSSDECLSWRPYSKMSK